MQSLVSVTKSYDTSLGESKQTASNGLTVVFKVSAIDFMAMVMYMRQKFMVPSQFRQSTAIGQLTTRKEGREEGLAQFKSYLTFTDRGTLEVNACRMANNLRLQCR